MPAAVHTLSHSVCANVTAVYNICLRLEETEVYFYNELIHAYTQIQSLNIYHLLRERGKSMLVLFGYNSCIL